MKVVELLKIGGEMLRLLSENEVMRDDWRYVPMYEEFMQMRGLGVKYTEAVRMLAEDYCIGRATVERIVARLDRDVKNCTDQPLCKGKVNCVKKPHKPRAGR